MKTTLILCFIVFLTANSILLNAQITFQKTIEGGGNTATVTSVISDGQGGFALTGFVDNGGIGGFDVILIRMDANGDTLFTKKFGGVDDDGGRAISLTHDGGFILNCFSSSFGDHVYLIRTDMNGDTLWTKTYANLLPGFTSDEGEDVMETSDHGFIISGESFGNQTSLFLIRTDANGDTLWTRSGAGAGPVTRAYSVRETMDGGFVVAGYTESTLTSSNDFYLLKLSGSGDTLWTRTYGATGNERAHCVRQLADGGFILAGSTTSAGAGISDVLLVRTDSVGNIIWEKAYGGSLDDDAYAIEVCDDGGFIVAGQTQSFGSGDADAYLFKTDMNGNLIWSKYFGGTDTDAFRSVAVAADKGFIAGGFSASFSSGLFAAYLVRTDSAGQSGCHENAPFTVTTTASSMTGTAFNLSSAPGSASNPATGVSRACSINVLCNTIGISETENFSVLDVYPLPFDGQLILDNTVLQSEYFIYDLNGQLLLNGSCQQGTTKIKTDFIFPGFYILAYSDGIKRTNRKLLKISPDY